MRYINLRFTYLLTLLTSSCMLNYIYDAVARNLHQWVWRFAAPKSREMPDAPL